MIRALRFFVSAIEFSNKGKPSVASRCWPDAVPLSVNPNWRPVASYSGLAVTSVPCPSSPGFTGASWSCNR